MPQSASGKKIYVGSKGGIYVIVKGKKKYIQLSAASPNT